MVNDVHPFIFTIRIKLQGVSKNRGGPPKSSNLIGFSIIFTIHFGVPIFLVQHPNKQMRNHWHGVAGQSLHQHGPWGLFEAPWALDIWLMAEIPFPTNHRLDGAETL